MPLYPISYCSIHTRTTANAEFADENMSLLEKQRSTEAEMQKVTSENEELLRQNRVYGQHLEDAANKTKNKDLETARPASAAAAAPLRAVSQDPSRRGSTSDAPGTREIKVRLPLCLYAVAYWRSLRESSMEGPGSCMV